MRDWIHVDDHCAAISKIIHDGIDGEKYNIAGQNEFNVLTVVQKILSVMGKYTAYYEYAQDRPGHDDVKWHWWVG